MKQYKNVRVCVLNYNKFYEAIQGEQRIKGAYTKEEVLATVLKQVKCSIDDFGIEILYNGSFESIQPSVARDLDKVYWLAIDRGILTNSGTTFMVYLYFKGFLE